MPRKKSAHKELSTSYSPNQVEDKWYPKWEESGAFKPTENSSESFTLMIPPPNVTGILTMGHVLNISIQDVLVRRARMQGKNTLWLPGTDHAAIATEAKVSHMLKEQGINKQDIDREEFLKHSWEWTEKYGGIIIKQLKRLGCSCDWKRERFTLDDDYYKSVEIIDQFIKKNNLNILRWDDIANTDEMIDYVFYKSGEDHKITILDYKINKTLYNKSDHLPIEFTIMIK